MIKVGFLYKVYLIDANQFDLIKMTNSVNNTEIVDWWAKTGLPDDIITDSISILDYFKI